jgi:molecular chaperone GrpE
MHDDKDFTNGGDEYGDEIEIEFIDTDPEPTPESTEVTSPEPDGVVPIEGESQQAEADKLRAELDHVRDIYLRKLAEFDNFRKRVDREREEYRLAGAEDFIRDLLPVLDNFERALEHADDDSGAFHEGVEMIAKQFKDTLERRGVAEVNPEGQQFDPELHEAVQRVEDSDQTPGNVAFVMLKGYTMGDRLIRPAMVGVVVETQGGDGGGES